MLKIAFQTLCLIAFSFNLIAAEEATPKSEPAKLSCKEFKEEFSETTHEVIIEGKPISYKATAGNLIIKDDKCEPKANFFFISYSKDGENERGKRPITFCFNGGPGSSSVWLHLGVLGPKRVLLSEQGDALPPYRLVDNEYSILDLTDLVFIDPISTGYSHAIPFDDAKKFHGVEEDIRSIAEFIRLYITRYNRWESPKFIVGESYGTARAAGLTGYLQDKLYLAINGVALVSSILNFQSIDFAVGNDLPYLLYLPSYTATAWYHKKLSGELQGSLNDAIEKAKHFVENEYSTALFKGDRLSPQESKEIVAKLAQFTGLSPEYVERSNLRVDIGHFTKELLRDQHRTVGRFDSRFKGIDANPIGVHPEYDPSAEAVFGAFTAVLNDYIKTDLKVQRDNEYKILSSIGQHWDYSVATNQYWNVSDTLRQAMTRNQYLRVFVASGYFDLATPFYATEYTFDHLGLNPVLKSHVDMKYYPAGHMMYIHKPTLMQFKEDLSHFYQETLEVQEKETATSIGTEQK